MARSTTAGTDAAMGPCRWSRSAPPLRPVLLRITGPGWGTGTATDIIRPRRRARDARRRVPKAHGPSCRPVRDPGPHRAAAVELEGQLVDNVGHPGDLADEPVGDVRGGPPFDGAGQRHDPVVDLRLDGFGVG